MSKRVKIHVTLPNGDDKWLTGATTYDAIANASFTLSNNINKRKTQTLKSFIDETYVPFFTTGLSLTTKESYDLYLHRYIIPFLGDKDIDAITVVDVQKFYDWMADSKKSGLNVDINKKTIERVGGLLGRLFRIAVDMSLIKESPMKKTLLRNNGKPASHHKAIERDDIDRIKQGIPNLSNERERLYMALLAYAGMRPEEILGMRWECVYLDEGFCEMKRTVTFPNNSRPCVRDRGKTEASIRTVALPLAAINILRTASNKKGYIIHGRYEEEPISFSTYQRMYRSAFKNLEVKCCNYDFRTTYGTELCEAGLTTKQVADMMGHANTRMVETVYARARHSGIMKNKDFLDNLNKNYA